MNKKELLEKLLNLDEKYGRDIEAKHSEADELLLKYINDSEITDAYNKIEKWYS